MSQLQSLVALYQELIVKSVFYEKDVYGMLGGWGIKFSRMWDFSLHILTLFYTCDYVLAILRAL